MYVHKDMPNITQLCRLSPDEEAFDRYLTCLSDNSANGHFCERTVRMSSLKKNIFKQAGNTNADLNLHQ